MKKRLTKDKIMGASTYILVTAAFLILQLLMSQGKLSSTMKGFLVPACAYIVLAISLNLLVGICGELSLGHAGFMGIGAFTGVIVTALLATAVPNGIVRLVIAMVVGGVMAGAIGFLIGIPVLRLRGDYLAIVTLAFGEIMKNIFGNLYLGIDDTGLHATMSSAGLTLGAGGQMIVSGPRGATGITKLSTFAVGFVLILFTLFVVQNLINSREGRAIKAVRDNRIAAESVGINVTAFRMKAFRGLRVSGGYGRCALRHELRLYHGYQVQFQYLHQHSGLRCSGRHGQHPRLHYLRHGALHPAGGHARPAGLPDDPLRCGSDRRDALYMVPQGERSHVRGHRQDCRCIQEEGGGKQ